MSVFVVAILIFQFLVYIAALTKAKYNREAHLYTI